jgi:hypothetical protein
MKTLILQCSPFHTASTFLINVIYGLIPTLLYKRIYGEWDGNVNENVGNHFDDIIVVKSHNLEIDELIARYGNKYNLYFVCSQRKEYKYVLDEKYTKYKNVIIFDYEELNETPKNTVSHIVTNIYNKICKVIPITFQLNTGIQRVQSMNKRYEEIKNQPFSFIDNFYMIHGSHRNIKM